MKKFQNILVAFDLNKTLFYKADKPVQNLKHDKKIRGLYFYFRPYLKQLIQFLHVYKVNYCFWSNMMEKNCLKYVKLLEQQGMSKHCGVFGQQFCDKIQGADQINIKSIKNLNKLAKKFKIDVDCCILVDDSRQKNVKGCHMIQIKQFQGKSEDKQILRVIEQLTKFRKGRAIEDLQNISMLKIAKQQFQIENQHHFQQKFKQQEIKPNYIQKMSNLSISQQPSQAQKLINDTPHLKKMKDQLVILKQEKKQISKEIEANQIKSKTIDQKIKKFGQVKIIRKGDSALMDLLMLAKQKKILQKTTQQCKVKKEKCANRLKQLKEQMHKQVQKLMPKHQQKQIEKQSNKKNKTKYQHKQQSNQKISKKQQRKNQEIKQKKQQI